MPITVPGFRFLRPAALFLAAAVTALTAACGSDAPSAAAPAPAAAPLAIRDPWVKAADSGMTAAFGTLVNDGPTDVTITAVATDVSPMELHEMAMKDGRMVMQQKPGGIVIKAKSQHVLEPGGDHLMLLNIAKPVKPGDELTFTLTFAGGGAQTFTAVAKPFTGANESYDPGLSGSPGMSMSPAR